MKTLTSAMTDFVLFSGELSQVRKEASILTLLCDYQQAFDTMMESWALESTRPAL